MRHFPTVLLVLIAFLTACQPVEKAPNGEQESFDAEELNTVVEFNFLTSDSIRITGDLYEINKKGNTILLFHQAGANARGEYATIIPKLTEAGFNVFAFDQRVGGQRFGSYNRTMANISNNKYGYCDAYPDLNGALDYVKKEGFTGKKIIWGSSYSAALVIQMGSKRPEDVAGVLAFSPASGAALADCDPNQYLASIKVPLLVLRPGSEMEHESVRTQFALAEEHGHSAYVAENGVHGSSMLVEEKTESDVADTWVVVMTFLAQF